VNSPPRNIAAGASLLVLAACASAPPPPSPPRSSAPDTAAGPASAPIDATVEASLDWRPLLLMPLGTLLKDTKVRLHEVLLFHEEPHAAGPIDPDDCYAVDGPAPEFAGTRPEEYLICFDHDRMDRVDARVLLPAEDARELFGRACDLWLRHGEALGRSEDACQGRDGDIDFSGRLTAVTGEDTAEVLIRLSNPAGREAQGAPP
jgi:hypothetical protein